MKIFLTRGAENNYRSICRYLTEKWSEAVAAAFENKVRDFLKVLYSFPEIGYIEVPEKQIRSFPITKQIRVFYRIRKRKIIIFSFFDVRQHSHKRPSGRSGG